MSTRVRAVVVAAVVLASATPAVAATERYFVLIFGSQSHPKVLRHTHTWATFVRAVGDGADPNGWYLEQNTISWLPASMVVRVWRPVPERGVNLDLDPTLRFILGDGQGVTLWGPFVIEPEIYARSLWVRQIAESGAAQYRAISTSYDMLVSDCIHAVAAVDPLFGRDHYPLIRIGKPASRFLAREIMVRSAENRKIDQAAFDNSWLIPRLGLHRYPITVVPPRQIPDRRCFLCRCPE
jgi:hypothetical protein